MFIHIYIYIYMYTVDVNIVGPKGLKYPKLLRLMLFLKHVFQGGLHLIVNGFRIARANAISTARD